jgi:hypothetical protein
VETEEQWQQVAGVLDECMSDLGNSGPPGNTLTILRNKSLVRRGEQLSDHAEAARKTVTRALEKLESQLVTKRKSLLRPLPWDRS